MARYHPKFINHPSWYYSGPVGNVQVSIGSSAHSADSCVTLPDMRSLHGHMVVPPYINSGYSQIPVANLQQNNAMPLLPYGRQSGHVDSSKSYSYVPGIPQALLGHPPPNLSQMNADCWSFGYPPHYIRAHPYSYVKRSSSSSSQRQVFQNSPNSKEVFSSYANNHSSTEHIKPGSLSEATTCIDSQPRSSSNCSTQQNSLADSPKSRSFLGDLGGYKGEISVSGSSLAVFDELQEEKSMNICAFLTGEIKQIDGSDKGELSDPKVSQTNSQVNYFNNQTVPATNLDLVYSAEVPSNFIDRTNPVQSVTKSNLISIKSRESQNLNSDNLNRNTTVQLLPTSLTLTGETNIDQTDSAIKSSIHSVVQNFGDIQQADLISNVEDQRDTETIIPSGNVMVSTTIVAASTSTSMTLATITTATTTTTTVNTVLISPNQNYQMIANQSIFSTACSNSSGGSSSGSNGVPLSFATAQPNGMQFVPSPLTSTGYMFSSSLYMDILSMIIWQFYTTTKQTTIKYAKKVHLRNALHMVVSGVFENAGLFIVGSSMNGFGSDQSDMDMCLTVTSRDLQQKKEAYVVLSQLLTPLRKCSFIKNLHLIRAKVPILKFRDTFAGVDCDLNVNNVVGIYNTHLLAMYTQIDWRVRPLGMFVKYWAQRMDIHDGSRGRLSTYPLLLMLIQYLQFSCSPPILPNLQARFPKLFNYTRPISELDMRLELPWAELRSNNPASLAELFVGFIHFYTNDFDFTRWAVSVRHGSPLPIDMAIRRLPPHEQAHTARSFKVFVEEPFCQANAARSLYDESVLTRIRQAFIKTNQALRSHRPLESIWINGPSETC